MNVWTLRCGKRRFTRPMRNPRPLSTAFLMQMALSTAHAGNSALAEEYGQRILQANPHNEGEASCAVGSGRDGAASGGVFEGKIVATVPSGVNSTGEVAAEAPGDVYLGKIGEKKICTRSPPWWELDKSGPSLRGEGRL